MQAEEDDEIAESYRQAAADAADEDDDNDLGDEADDEMESAGPFGGLATTEREFVPVTCPSPSCGHSFRTVPNTEGQTHCPACHRAFGVSSRRESNAARTFADRIDLCWETVRADRQARAGATARQIFARTLRG